MVIENPIGLQALLVSKPCWPLQTEKQQSQHRIDRRGVTVNSDQICIDNANQTALGQRV